jgi:diaminopimelate epimerase
MKWSRWSGAGNTFLIADSWSQSESLPGPRRGEIARQLCHSFDRAETDGLLFLEPSEGYDFAWDFYNSDGSRAEMCGNAARCAAMYFHRKIRANKKHFKFLTLAGEIGAEILSSSSVKVKMPQLPTIFGKIEGHFHVNTGVPHLVLPEEPNVARAQALRPLPSGPGSNITFVIAANQNGCKAVTFERGVENFTLACGTGAVAAATFLNQRFGGSRFEVEMPGGSLIVANVGAGKTPELEGPAIWNYDFEL